MEDQIMFDKKDFECTEYSTERLKELDFLASKGIKYVFAKTSEKGIRIYKYKKTKELFLALAEFYN
jgi:hypothetical protein